MAEENKITEEIKTEETPVKEEVLATESETLDFRAGDMVKDYQKIKDKEKERIQIFEGQVLFAKHGKEIGATITVRKVVGGIGIEKTFPIHSPLIEKIEVVKKLKARRAKLYYLRDRSGKSARIREKLPARSKATSVAGA